MPYAKFHAIYPQVRKAQFTERYAKAVALAIAKGIFVALSSRGYALELEIYLYLQKHIMESKR